VGNDVYTVTVGVDIDEVVVSGTKVVTEVCDVLEAATFDPDKQVLTVEDEMKEVYDVDGAAVAVVVEITQIVVGDAVASVTGAGSGKYVGGGVRVGVGGG